jgi:hypothetical protein
MRSLKRSTKMYTSEQRYQLEKEFVVKLAAYENWEVDPSTIHLAAETLSLAKALARAIKKVT